MKKIIKNLTAAVLIIFALTALILDAKGMADSAIKAIETCLYTIIPSLFGFMAVSSYLLNSGFYKVLFKPLYLIFRYIIKLNEEEFGIFLLSLFGGYPVGAKLISDRAVSSEQKPRDILPFCYCPSPGFAMSVAGTAIFSNAEIGLAVYVSNVLACVFLAVIFNFKNRKKPAAPAGIVEKHFLEATELSGRERQSRLTVQPMNFSLSVFTSSILSASSALFPVCSVIVAFGFINEALRFFGAGRVLMLLGEKTDRIFFAMSEISNISGFPPNLSLLPLIAAIFSFGGFCIITQIPALTKGTVPLKRFFLWRIPAAVLSAIICKLIMPLFGFAFTMPVTAGHFIIPSEAGHPVASAALFIMAVMLVKTAEEK